MTKPSPSHWLVAALRCLFYCITLSLWTRNILLEPLRVEAIEMVRFSTLMTLTSRCAHATCQPSHIIALRLSLPTQAHMDPTEIIIVPIPLSRLQTFVGFAFLSLFVVSVPWWQVAALWRHVQVLIVATVAMVAISITCGAHPTNNLHSTILASLYVALLLTMNPPVFCDGISDFWTTQTTVMGDDMVSKCRVYATLLVMIPFQILNILDSGLQVQRWPLAMILGSTVGWVMGSVVGFLWAIYTTIKVQRVTEQNVEHHFEKKDRYI